MAAIIPPLKRNFMWPRITKHHFLICPWNFANGAMAFYLCTSKITMTSPRSVTKMCCYLISLHSEHSLFHNMLPTLTVLNWYSKCAKKVRTLYYYYYITRLRSLSLPNEQHLVTTCYNFPFNIFNASACPFHTKNECFFYIYLWFLNVKLTIIIKMHP